MHSVIVVKNKRDIQFYQCAGRALLCLLDDAYRLAPLLGQLLDLEVCKVPASVGAEWIMLAVLGSCAVSDLRAAAAEYIYCTDASDTARAVCRAPIPSQISQELWHHREKRGYHTQLAGRDEPFLAALASAKVKKRKNTRTHTHTQKTTHAHINVFSQT